MGYTVENILEVHPPRNVPLISGFLQKHKSRLSLLEEALQKDFTDNTLQTIEKKHSEFKKSLPKATDLIV